MGAAREPSTVDPEDGSKWPSDVAVDGAGDVYVSGLSVYAGTSQAAVLKLAGADGAVLHSATCAAATGPSAAAVAVRGQAVAVTGTARQAPDQEDALVVRVDCDLAEQWRLGYADPRGVSARDFRSDVAIGAHGNVFVAGYSNYPPSGGSGRHDSGLVFKVNDAGSAAQWATRYKPSGMGASFDHLVLDGADNLHIAGYLDTDASHENALVMKY